MTSRAIPAALTILLLSCSSPPPKPAPEPHDPKYRVQRLVAQIDANLFGEADDAVAQLAAVGRRGVPFMKEELKTAGDKARPLLALALESVYATDPYYWVRAPDRRVSARLKSASRKAAYDELFRAFPIRPRYLQGDDFSKPAPEATIWFDGASYWETVRRFCLSYSMNLDDGFFEPGTWRGWSEPNGPFIVRAEKAGAADRLEVRLHLQPGSSPIDGVLHSLRVLDSAGREIEGASIVLVEEPGGNFMPLNDRSASATLGGADITLREGRASGPLTVTGSARVLVPSDIETAVWTRRTWSEDPERTIGGCLLTLKNFESCNFRFAGPDKPEGAAKADASECAWLFLSHDQGRLQNMTRLTLTGSGEVSGANWPHPEPFQRITLVRPSKSEAVEFPFEIKYIPWP